MKNSSRIIGVNLGGWLMMEGYILHGRNIAESVFKKEFLKVNGKNALAEFEKSFRDAFITEKDFKNIASIGANTVRIPFNHKAIESSPRKFNGPGVSYLDKAFLWAKKYGLKIILDLHAAPGSQNCDWHSDCEGVKARFWDNAGLQQRAFALWDFLSDRYKNKEALLGYDLLNEPVLDKDKEGVLKRIYAKMISVIRKNDSTHTIFLEGSVWAQKIDFLKSLIDKNVSISIHYYHPLNYCFNYTPFIKFPGNIQGGLWNEKKIERSLSPYYGYSIKNKVKIYAGEFGINWRGGHFGEEKWLSSVLKTFKKFNFGYTYWTYKAIANSVFPDGIYRYIGNNEFIRREGPAYGWENYIPSWKKDKNCIKELWDTKNYVPNKEIIKLLKKDGKNI